MKRTRPQRGVTLIELLVVLAILALMAGAVAFNLPPARDDAKREAERFAALLSAAANEAIVDGRPLRVEIAPTAYSFWRFERGEWRAADESEAISGRALNGVAMETVVEDPAMRNESRPTGTEAVVRRIFLDPIGAAAPFTVDFTSRRERWRVERGIDGTITVTENAGS